MSHSQNNREFFSRQVEESLDALFAAAIRLTQHAADAEDLVAGTVEKAWKCIDTLGDRDRFRPWIFRILRNHFISGYRKKSVRPVECGFEENSAEPAEPDLASWLMEQSDDFLNWWANPERVFFNQLLGSEIMAAIEALPSQYRVVIQLINVEGFGYDEAAGVLGIPTGTVRSRMKRGRTLLQKSLWLHARESGLAAHSKPKGELHEQTR
jgi:RNA polymerase sigma-70 factor (ECF subfamily)